MKKNWYGLSDPLKRQFKKLLLMTKLTIFLSLFFVVQLSANVYSQTRLTVASKNKTVKEVLSNIENQSEFRFFYNEQFTELNRQVKFNIENQSIQGAMDELFKSSNFTYKIMENNLIVITPDDSEQSNTVSGKVTEESGQPLPGVTVVVKGTTNGTVTNTDGNYTLSNIPENAILVFSFVGMKTQEVVIGTQTSVNIKMVADAIGIEEIVTIGYGTQKKVNLTGAVSTVNLERIENRPITNSSQALQGVPGVYVNQAGGQPGKDDATIRIRGQGTLNNNNPLVLVDGIEFSLADINPNDIESISVLKDAASASIYGNRAANGVVLVTTKQGKEDISKVEYSNYFGVQAPTYLPDVITDPVQFMELRDQAQRNAGRTTVDYGSAVIEEYRQGMVTDPYIYPNNNWLDIMFDNAFIQEHNLRFSGGKEKINYTLSLGYLDQEGVLMGTNSEKISFRTNVNFQINDKIKIGSDFAMNHQNIHEPSTTAATMMEMVFKAQAFHPTYLEDGRYADTWVRTPGHNVFRHPIVWATEGYQDYKNVRGLASLYANIELPFGISYNAKAGVNKLDGFQSQFVPDIYMYQNKTLQARRVDYYTTNKNRHVTNGDNEDLNITLFNTLNWSKSLNSSHNFTALLGSSYEKFTSRYFTATIEGFLGNNLHEINAGSTNPSTTGTSSENTLIGFFGRINYDFQQKYLFEANLRYDGSSKFAEGNRWGVFPSFSAGWRLDQEDFMSDINWLTGLKLRVSYGSLGNERIGNFKYVNLIDAGYNYYIGSSVNSGAAITAYNDPNITWEKTSISNIGVDGVFFENKLNITIELYNKLTDDILRPINLPAQVGNLTGPVMNIGSVSNKGYEISVGHRNSLRDFTYQVDLGINYNVNNVEDLNGEEIVNTGSPGYLVPTIIKEGYPIDSYYLLESDGIFQTQEEINNSPFQNITTKPGYLKYKDQNNDKVINADDRIITGGAIPNYTFDFSLNLSYKNWSLSGFFNGVQGIYTYPQRIIATPFWFGTSVTKNWVENSWRPDRTDASLPILTPYEESVNDNFLYSDFWLLDASYIRLKNLQISYSFSNELIKKIGLDKLVLFMNGQNIFTLSKMKDFDPERNIKQNSYYEYPSIKTFSAGLNVTF
jgi:TonB-linked SusC/RagA family outer membrane protein